MPNTTTAQVAPRKVIITLAPTGGMASKAMSAHLPTQPEEIADQVAECVELGASIAALHARRPDDDAATCNPDVYARINELVRERCDVVINNSTGGGVDGDMIKSYDTGELRIDFRERMKGLEADIAARRSLVHRYRELLDGVAGLSAPYTADEVHRSSCYVMPVMLEDPEIRPDLQRRLLEGHGVQTSVLYAALQGLTAYDELAGPGLERSELAARTELTVPLYPHLTHEDQDRVVAALVSELQAV